MDKIRVGIVGASVTPSGSRWGSNAHVPAIKALPEYELKAVCTAHEESAKASAEAFGAELAFHNIDDMVAHPDVDLVVVSVRVPVHYPLVMAALRAGKQVFCEWPLGANLAQAEEMASLARAKSLATFVGLQGRSDATLTYAREFVQEGSLGEVLAASMTVTSGAAIERTPDRIWQSERAAGANTLTISGGHSIDALCFVLGEFAEVSARVETRIKQWRLAGSGQPVPVDAPDYFAVAGRLEGGAEVSVQVAAVPFGSNGYRLDVYGSQGALTITSGSVNIGPNQLFVTRGREPAAPAAVPDRFKLVPEGTPAGQPLNVAQAYTRFADSLNDGGSFDPDFELAVRRHRLIDAIERSAREGRSVSL